jgi:glycosyltransferase involved in cell wall biosynthesis
LFFIGAYSPGQGSSALHEHYVGHLGRQGHDVTIATLAPALRGGEFVQRGDGGSAPLLRIACSRSPGERALNAISAKVFRYPFFLTGLAGYRQILLRERFDVVHAETIFPLGAMVTFPGVLAPARVLIAQGEDLIVEPDYDYGHRRFAMPRALVRRALRTAEVIRTHSPLIHDLALAAGAPPSRTVLVPDAIRHDAIPPDVAAFRRESRAAMRSRLGVAAEAPLVLAFGRLHPFKGLDALVRALGVLHRQGAPLVAAFCGGSKRTERYGDYRRFLQRLVREEGVEAIVRFHEEIPNDDAARMLACADVVVVPSTREGSNRVTIEAAAVGTPVVVTRTAGIAGFLDGENWAVIAPNRDAEVLADGIRRALGLATVALTSGPTFARRFLPGEIAPQLVGLYRRAVEAARAPHGAQR